MNKATAHKVLKSLESTGLAMQDPVTRQYSLGPLIHQIAADPVQIHQDLVRRVYPRMVYLRDATKETIGLQLLVSSRRLVIEELPSPHALKFAGGVGLAGPVFSGASGTNPPKERKLYQRSKY